MNKTTGSGLASLTLVLLFSMITTTGLRAAQEDGEVSSIKFTCLHWEGIPDEKLYYREGEQYQLLKLRQGKRSEMLPLKGMANFELYVEAEHPGEGESPYELLSKAAIPPGMKQVMFVIIPVEKEEEVEEETVAEADEEADEEVDEEVVEEAVEEEVEYRVVAMDDSAKAFPRGTFRFANFTAQTLSVEFSGAQQEVAADMVMVMDHQVGKAGAFVPCIIRNPEGKTIFGTRLFAQPSARELVLVRPSQHKKGKALMLKFYNQPIAAP